MSAMSRIHGELTELYGEGFVVLTAAERQWIMSAMYAIRSNDLGEMRRVGEQANSDSLDCNDVWEMSFYDCQSALTMMSAILLTDDHGDADALARDYGRPQLR